MSACVSRAETETARHQIRISVSGSWCLSQNAAAEHMSLCLMEMEIGDKRGSRNLLVEKQCLFRLAHGIMALCVCISQTTDTTELT